MRLSDNILIEQAGCLWLKQDHTRSRKKNQFASLYEELLLLCLKPAPFPEAQKCFFSPVPYPPVATVGAYEHTCIMACFLLTCPGCSCYLTYALAVESNTDSMFSHDPPPFPTFQGVLSTFLKVTHIEVFPF